MVVAAYRARTEAGDPAALADLGEPAPELIATLELTAGALLLLGLPILLLELWRLWRRGRLAGARGRGMLTSAFCLLPATLVEIVGFGALFALYYAVAELAPSPRANTWATAAACLVLVDLCYYVEHRLAHRVNLLWSLYHSVHHSADHFDQTVALRVSFMDFFFSPLIYLPLVAGGFDPVLVLVCLGLVLAWQQWLHTELVGRLPPLDPWLNTPSNHRVHHGRSPEYVDTNYGGILMIWDRIFGTYAPERASVDYGLVAPLASRHPLAVHFHVFVKLLRGLRRAPSLRRRLRLLLGPPGGHGDAAS